MMRRPRASLYDQVVSTRGGSVIPAAAAILSGLAPDGGLYVPARFPHFTPQDILRMAGQPYWMIARRIITALLPSFDPDELSSAIRSAYAPFGEDAAPLRRLSDNNYILELYHGPTLAFKDFALQLLPSLMSMASRQLNLNTKRLILVATSGDTGKAALEAFAGRDDAAIIVFYPEDGVSETQRLQMITQREPNTFVAAVQGNFDDAQRGVKSLLASESFTASLKSRGYDLASANSINYGRLIPQIAYYFSAYASLLRQGAVTPGGSVRFCVPTGNFGNILAADYARRMGLPIGKLICASNRNRILTDFITTGLYDANRAFHTTTSPSMDILISSNLERFLFEITGRDDAKVRQWLADLKTRGVFRLTSTELAPIKARMLAGYTSDEDARSAIERVWRNSHILIDPHTAVGADVLDRADLPKNQPAVLVSTASPFKFGKEVARAVLPRVSDDVSDMGCCHLLAESSGAALPPSLAKLHVSPIRHKLRCEAHGMHSLTMDIIAALP